MGNHHVVSEDTLQPLAQKLADGEGSDGVDPIVRPVYAAVILEMWVDVTALLAGGPMEFVLESTLDEVGWVEVARISNVNSTGTFAAALAKRGVQPLGKKVRGRWEFTGGVGDATFRIRLIQRE